MELKEIIKNRRTHKLYSGQEVPLDLVRSFLETAIHAPNHKRNEPWQFIVLEKELMSSFFSRCQPAFQAVFSGLSDEKKENKSKKLEKLFSDAGAVVFTLCEKSEDSKREKENYAAVSCVIQNLMLLAQEKNLGSFWSTNSLFESEQLAPLIGYDSNSHFLAGAIFLGDTTGSPKSPHFQIDHKLKTWTSTDS